MAGTTAERSKNIASDAYTALSANDRFSILKSTNANSAMITIFIIVNTISNPA